MIEIRNIVKKYGNLYAVNNVSFTVNTGEIVGFWVRTAREKARR